jgi:hypothetical protein
VKGAIEVRVGPQGIKAKWVRIELRKVETLPGGGQANTFFDFVGPSPVNLWQSSEEFGTLRTQDFPFYIRIPESIPPSIALENRAGIKYELVATVCTRGKRGFLRRAKSVVVSTMASIIIDKHDLHSTWPVYCQPESRHLAQEGVILTVERMHTCYGPGDRLSVMATLKSDSLHTVILRGFELTLKESTIFRAGPYASAKKGPPQARVIIIGEHKQPVNATLYGGTMQKAELFCDISPKHTTTSLNSARHIDITYTLSVRALMGTGAHLILDLPIILSNWPRNVSVEAVRRIGTATSLSLLPPNTPSGTASSLPPRMASPPITAPAPTQPRPPSPLLEYPSARPPNSTFAQTLPNPARTFQRDAVDSGLGRNISATSLTTAPNGYPRPDEFGYARPPRAPAAVDTAGYSPRPQPGHKSSNSWNSVGTDESTRPANARRRSGGGPSNPSNRFTITNVNEEEIPKESEPSASGAAAPAATAASPAPAARNLWPTAEDEKKRLYEQARAKVERVQGTVASPTPKDPTTPPPAQVDAGQVPQAAQTSPRGTPWPTAEEEKLRLFNQAQATAQKMQTYGSSYSSASLHGRTNSTSEANGSGSSSKPAPSSSGLTGAALYSSAMVSRPSRTKTPSPNVSPATSPGKPPVPQYLTAEQEKAALRRYNEARSAVDRTQGFDAEPTQPSSSSPIPYDSLYPSRSTPASATVPAPAPAANGNEPPPPFDMSAVPESHLPEKERMRRAYEAQDAAAQQPPPGGTPPYVPERRTPPPFASSSHGHAQPLPEKALLQKRFEAQDAAALGSNGHPQPPPRTPSSPHPAPRPPPAVPGAASGSKILTAIEEKAELKAKYEAHDRATGSPSPPPGPSAAGSSAPPPLAPRPPKAYIIETQDEDGRVSRMLSSSISPPFNGAIPPQGFDMRPYQSFTGTMPPPPQKYTAQM